MTKTKAIKEIYLHYKIFSDNSLNALSLNFDVPDSLEYLKLEKEIAIKRHIISSDLTENQIIASNGYLASELNKIEKYPAILHPMILIYVISLFEIFLKHTIKILLKFDKKTLKNSDRQIPLNTIMSFSNYNDLIDNLLDKIVHDLGYKNITDQISFLNKNLKINLSFKKGKGIIENRRFIDRDEIQEIFLVRNLILHNGGIINKIYSDLSKRNDISQGEKIEVTKDYLNNSFGTIWRGSSAILRQSKIFIKEYKLE